MSQTVQLMMVFQIRKASVHTVNNIVRIQIPIFHLRRTYYVNRFIRRPFQFHVWVSGKGISDCFNPFRKITVLKHKAVKTLFQMLHILRQRFKSPKRIYRLFKRRPFFPFLLHQPARNFKIAHTKAGTGALYTVI